MTDPHQNSLRTLVERLLKRAKEDRECAKNNEVTFALLKPEFDKFEKREAPHNIYAVRMAVDHRNSAKRDNAWADDLEQAADAIEGLVAERDALREAAEFLCARVRELVGAFTDNDSDETTSEFFGHVVPAVARMEAALSPTSETIEGVE